MAPAPSAICRRLWKGRTDMEFEYTLKKEEYMDYCAGVLLAEPTFRKLRHRCWPIVPVILILLIAAFFPVPWWAYAAAAAASLGWVLLVNLLVARTIKKTAVQRCEQAGEKAYRPLRVKLADGKLEVNGAVRSLKDYRLFSNLILLFLEDGSCVVLPQRVFGESGEAFGQVIAQIDLCLKK